MASEKTADVALFPTTNLYQDIAKENLKSLSNIKLNDNDFDFENFDAATFFKAQFEQLLHPDPLTRRHSMLTLLSKFEEKNPLPQTDVLDQKTWLDLEVLCGPKSNTSLYLASQLDRTVTEAGKAAFYRKMVNPMPDIKQLENQQAIVAHLLNNESLFNEINEKLNALVESENLMLSFWYSGHFYNPTYDKIKFPFASKIEGIKYLENWINKSPAIWQARNAEGSVFKHISQALFFYWFLAVPIYACTGTDLASYLPKNIYESKWIPKAKDLSNFSAFSMISMLGITSWIISNISKDRPGWENVDRFSKGGLTLLDKFDELYWKIKNFSENNEQDKYFYAKVIHVARYINNLKSMACTVSKDKELATRMPSITAFNEYLAKLEKTSTDMNDLLKLLEKKTFDGNYSSWLIYWGRVKVAFTLIAELKEQFVEAMIPLGELDAQLSIAKLYKEFQNKRVTFCFPKYIDPIWVDAPSVKAIDFWNPLVDSEKVVPSSLDIGKPYEKPQNVIITGPNASGKSTITKAFIMTVMLAQSLGIAPAKELTLTPFRKIITYLNITDDIAAGNSHFKAGVLRAREVAATFENLNPHEFGLTAIDEVFNGTTFHEGRAAAYSLIKILGSHPSGMCITNTHFQIIPTLEQITGRFTNYKVSVIEQQDEKIQYPFKLEQGISDQNVAFKILREEGFGDEFINQAQHILDEQT